MIDIPSQCRHSTEEQGASGGDQDSDGDDASHSRLNVRRIAAPYRTAGVSKGEAKYFHPPPDICGAPSQVRGAATVPTRVKMVMIVTTPVTTTMTI